MALNVQCPKCGSHRVQLSYKERGHGCLWTIFFGFYYIAWMFIKYIIGFYVFILYDWWMAIIRKASGKGHIWICNRWFSNSRRIYYCHSCGNNFKV